MCRWPLTTPGDAGRRYTRRSSRPYTVLCSPCCAMPSWLAMRSTTRPPCQRSYASEVKGFLLLVVLGLTACSALLPAGSSLTPTTSPKQQPTASMPCDRVLQTRLAGQSVQSVAVFESTAVEVAAWQESGLIPGGGRAGPGMSPLRSRPATEIITSCYFDGNITLRMPIPQGGVPPVFERVLFLVDQGGLELQVLGGTKSLFPLLRPSAP